MTNLELQAQEEKDFQEMMVKPSAGTNWVLTAIFIGIPTAFITIMNAASAGTIEDHVRTQVSNQTATVEAVMVETF